LLGGAAGGDGGLTRAEERGVKLDGLVQTYITYQLYYNILQVVPLPYSGTGYKLVSGNVTWVWS